jgi:hypothetical protein
MLELQRNDEFQYLLNFDANLKTEVIISEICCKICVDNIVYL